jgi:AraC-like DNA-binding protein
VAASFRREVGLPPKRAARVLRFHHAVGRINADQFVSLSAVAAECGYYDQAHFTREFREFAGRTPTEFIRSRLPVGVGG